MQGHVVTSPAVTITLPGSARYLGTDTFTLTDPKLGPFDDCKLFVFVEANGKEIQKLYWVQFEEYKPSHPELHHAYNSPRHVEIGGLDFYVDTWTSTGKDAAERGSDTEHFNALLTANRYMRVPMTVVRLVHLFDKAKRKELMIIYGEAETSDTETVLQHAIARVRIGQGAGG
ncbi:hypothetical protein [Rhizomicrobium electricum]|uniref:Uncharacterized protein n=1 Tax=Rhizomicrobium electricum TaxID=480070 RepID=A0ABN1EYX9_9PROT|nr:hypothetical protein [Rhizomicrobium electricum]NIJ49789.1 hypothetical protein [Rhizomicrobium electricum]